MIFRLLTILLFPIALVAQQAPAGLDAYRQWDLLPLQRMGVRAYMRSTYDRLSRGSDAGHFLFMKGEDENVTLDVKGKGFLYFFRANHWHGSPWHFTIDGQDHVVKESATDDPVNALKNIREAKFIPDTTFHEPMSWTWTTTKGADLIWMPMSFQDSLRIAYSRTFYGTGYYIYHLFNDGVGKTVRTSAKEVEKLMDSAGLDIAPKGITTIRGRAIIGRTVAGRSRAESTFPTDPVVLACIDKASSVVRAFKLTLPLDKAMAVERLRLRITWDHAVFPSVEAPLCLFFGAGTFFNREKKEFLVKGLPINVRFDYPNNKVELACYYPMPFFQQAKFELVGSLDEGLPPGGVADNIPTGSVTGSIPKEGAAASIPPVSLTDSIPVDFEIRYAPLRMPARRSSLFHATYVDIPRPTLGQDMVWLDTRGVEGHRDWSGSFLGTSFIFSHNADLYTLEGDPRFFFDGSQTPQAYGTGTEEWAGGGDYWGGENMTLPLAGHPCGSRDKKTAVNDKDLIQSAYRFLLADLMPFGQRALIRFEHSENVSSEHYEAVTYWYGLPAPSLVKTDSLDIGAPADEVRHAYHSPDASAVEKITSRYEWGPDILPAGAWGYDVKKIPGYVAGTVLYPPQEEDGRHTLGVSEFTVKLDPANEGVLLRRTLDYSYPNQTAEVSIQAGGKKGAGGKWERVGVWYLAGSNTCVTSAPSNELGRRQYIVQTSNRQLRDDEFLLPARLTKGRSSIRIRIRCIPDHQELYPGHAFPKKSCWSELKYDIYSYVNPNFSIDGQ
ncbi:MAG: DUF2961 domain-containing protein [Bacteroidota bacterium]